MGYSATLSSSPPTGNSGRACVFRLRGRSAGCKDVAAWQVILSVTEYDGIGTQGIYAAPQGRLGQDVELAPLGERHGLVSGGFCVSVS